MSYEYQKHQHLAEYQMSITVLTPEFWLAKVLMEVRDLILKVSFLKKKKKAKW